MQATARPSALPAYCPKCETDLDEAAGVCPACHWDPSLPEEAPPPELQIAASYTERYRGVSLDAQLAALQAARPAGISRGRAFVITAAIVVVSVAGVASGGFGLL